MEAPPLYTHPGRAYIDRAGLPRRAEDVAAYVEGYAAFLLEAAGIGGVPVDLDRICQRFSVRWDRGALPEGTEGWSDGARGRILLNEDRPEVRQRFTHGHELVELLVSALVESAVSDEVWHALQGPRKEALCNRGAGALLLPRGWFEEAAWGEDVSLLAARRVAGRFGASLLATLIGFVERGPGLHALVGWRRTLKPAELPRADPLQLSLGPECESCPVPRLRVAWVRHTARAAVPFVPRHKSIPDASVVGRAAVTGCDVSGFERLDLGGLCGRCYVEALPTRGSVADVVSLIHLPGDGCRCAN